MAKIRFSKVDGQGVLVVESDTSHFTYGRISILIGFGNLVGIVLRSTGDKLYYSVVVFNKRVIMQDYSTRPYGF
jgi:hypothetical protein